MRKHLETEQLSAYEQRRLSPAELIEADTHLAECSACRRRLEAALPITATALYVELQNETDRPTHLSFEQTAAYVDDTLNHTDSLIVSDHLATCWQCAHEVKDLRQFVATDVPRPVVTAIESKTSWWESVRAWISIPSLGWAMAALFLVVLAGWIMRTLWQSPTATPQIAQQEITPTPLPVRTPTPPVTETVQFLVQLNDGNKQITLDQRGKLSGLEELSPAQQQMVKDALTTQRLGRSSALADLQRRGSSLMGADDEGHRFALQTPVAKVLLSDRPIFKWSPLAGATNYVVEIYDEQFNLTAQSEPLTQTQWTLSRPLARGKVFAWQVKATKDGLSVTAPAPPAPQARFRVTTSTQTEEISRAKRAGSSLTLALLYAQAGLIDEAEAELRTLRQANPDSEVVRRWLSQLQAMRR